MLLAFLLGGIPGIAGVLPYMWLGLQVIGLALRGGYSVGLILRRSGCECAAKCIPQDTTGYPRIGD